MPRKKNQNLLEVNPGTLFEIASELSEVANNIADLCRDKLVTSDMITTNQPEINKAMNQVNDFASNQQDSYGNGIPNPVKVNGLTVIGVQKDGNNITHLQLSDGQLLDYTTVINAVEQGNTEGIIVQDNQKGEPILRSKPDGVSENNLDNLPLVNQ